MNTLRGIFPGLQATFSESGEIDMPSMVKQASHCIEAGAHGLVFPVMNGELPYISEGERQKFVESVIQTASNQIPVVVGVAAPSISQAAERAMHARKTGADAVIALPPYIKGASSFETKRYYQVIAENAEVPVFLQHIWPGPSIAFLVELIHDCENILYIKEETPPEDFRPSDHSITAVIEATGSDCLGVFGSDHGYYMIPEMRRGVSGFIPAAQCTEVYVAIWESFQSGNEEEARRIFSDLQPFLTLLADAGLRLCKEVLVRRGVIRTSTMREPNVPMLDEYYRHELDLAFDRLKRYL